MTKDDNTVTTVEEVIKAVAAYFEMPTEVITQPKEYTSKHASYARQMVAYVSKKITFKSFKAIGKTVGADHSSIIYGFDRIQDRIIAKDALTIRQVDDIFNSILKPPSV